MTEALSITDAYIHHNAKEFLKTISATRGSTVDMFEITMAL